VLKDGVALPPLSQVAAGMLAAAVVGILSLRVLRYMIRHAQFALFGWYCVILAGLVLLWQTQLIPGWL